MPALLRIVIYSEATWWCACALECDVQAFCKTAEAALDTVVQIVETHVAADIRMGREPLSGFSVTPQQIWTKFSTAARLKHPVELNRTDSPVHLRYLVATLN
jgi:hypothetical protein